MKNEKLRRSSRSPDPTASGLRIKNDESCYVQIYSVNGYSGVSGNGKRAWGG